MQSDSQRKRSLFFFYTFFPFRIESLRNVKLGAYDEEQDTWEITEGLKETDYIVWPDGECKEGAAVQKNENVQAGGMEEGE